MAYHVESLNGDLLPGPINAHHLPYPPLVLSLEQHHAIIHDDIAILPPTRIEPQPLLHRQLLAPNAVRMDRAVGVLLRANIALRRQRAQLVVLAAHLSGQLDVALGLAPHKVLLLSSGLPHLMVVLGLALGQAPGSLPFGHLGAAEDGLHRGAG